ncbi:MAG TPA: caspase family protein [Thermoanaerobaculia bacterium]|nr:caspase family protein [Thermoanaerobaculia bacterium]
MPLRLAIMFALALVVPAAVAAPHRYALLIGINDYTASRLPAIGAAAPDRDWPNLAGAVNDTTAMRELLLVLHGFDARDIVTLNDQSATRSAILGAANRLAATATKDDVIFIYFAGHGSQVKNSRSDEPDKLDESIIPADSRRGAPDIRDKELRRIFNAILDRGARLTVMIDACHSGSAARGLLTLARPRGIRPDLRDVADGGDYGPRPENRGALVISASHDDEEAREARDDRHTMHGAFTWAWMRAMRDAAPDEPAIETFTRAQARLRAEMPFQNPILAGDAEQRLRPFLGTGNAVRGARMTLAVERVRSDGTAVISGGWAHGITAGSELRVVGDRSQPQLTVTALLGLGRCEAHVPAEAHVRSGTLLELTGWAAPPPRPLHVAIPRLPAGVNDVASFARRAAAIAANHEIEWISDPTVRTPEHLLRRTGARWELLDAAGHASSFGSDDDAFHALARLPRGTSLFVQLPATEMLAAQIAGPAVIDVVDNADDADYVLAGRFVQRHVEYAWVRPNARHSDRHASGLPLRTTWITDAGADTAFVLRHRALRLHKIEAWSLLESPPEARWPYRLALRRERDGQLVADGGSVAGNDTYSLELRAVLPMAVRTGRRHVYVFTIDSYGQSTLLYPVSGSVENHFPLAGAAPPPPVIPLSAKFEVAPPYGVDTYILLATDEPFADPWILQWDGVRGPKPTVTTALERLVVLTGSTERGTGVLTPATWSIERLVIESVRPRHKRAASVSLPHATSAR